MKRRGRSYAMGSRQRFCPTSTTAWFNYEGEAPGSTGLMRFVWIRGDPSAFFTPCYNEVSQYLIFARLQRYKREDRPGVAVAAYLPKRGSRHSLAGLVFSVLWGWYFALHLRAQNGDLVF